MHHQRYTKVGPVIPSSSSHRCRIFSFWCVGLLFFSFYSVFIWKISHVHFILTCERAVSFSKVKTILCSKSNLSISHSVDACGLSKSLLKWMNEWITGKPTWNVATVCIFLSIIPVFYKQEYLYYLRKSAKYLQTNPDILVAQAFFFFDV